MKVNVDYEMVLSATDKLENGETLSKEEIKEIAIVLKAVQGDYIPTKKELEIQGKNIERLDEINVDKFPNKFNQILEKCTEFENKYC